MGKNLQFRDRILTKIKNKEDLSYEEMQCLEIALTLKTCYDNILDVTLGFGTKEDNEYFEMNYISEGGNP